jgi:hypothetical protein
MPLSTLTPVQGERDERTRCFNVRIATVARFGFVDRNYGLFCCWRLINRIYAKPVYLGWKILVPRLCLVTHFRRLCLQFFTANEAEPLDLVFLGSAWEPVNRNYKNCAVKSGFTRVFAHSIPDAATAGIPIPGMVLSPTKYKPLTDVFDPGNVPVPAAIAGP